MTKKRVIQTNYVVHLIGFTMDELNEVIASGEGYYMEGHNPLKSIKVEDDDFTGFVKATIPNHAFNTRDDFYRVFHKIYPEIPVPKSIGYSF